VIFIAAACHLHAGKSGYFDWRSESDAGEVAAHDRA